MPLMGVFRHVVVAESDAKALDIARAAYRPWRDNMAFLWDWGGIEFPVGGIFPKDFDALQQWAWASLERRKLYAATSLDGRCDRRFLFVADMVFGSIQFDAASLSVDLFAREVMPKFR